jgi:hypothetical protein
MTGLKVCATQLRADLEFDVGLASSEYEVESKAIPEVFRQPFKIRAAKKLVVL